MTVSHQKRVTVSLKFYQGEIRFNKIIISGIVSHAFRARKNIDTIFKAQAFCI